MLAEAKDNSELMIDLAYAAVFFNDPGMADEVAHLEEHMNDLVQSMREVCILACRRPAEAESMAGRQLAAASCGMGKQDRAISAGQKSGRNSRHRPYRRERVRSTAKRHGNFPENRKNLPKASVTREKAPGARRLVRC